LRQLRRDGLEDRAAAARQAHLAKLEEHARILSHPRRKNAPGGGTWWGQERRVGRIGVGDALMARAIWSGSISFGLLNVPVKLYSAVARRGISLRELR